MLPLPSFVREERRLPAPSSRAQPRNCPIEPKFDPEARSAWLAAHTGTAAGFHHNRACVPHENTARRSFLREKTAHHSCDTLTGGASDNPWEKDIDRRHLESRVLISDLCCNKVKLSPWKVSMIHANTPLPSPLPAPHLPPSMIPA